ncbi:MAG: hypothetical protein WAK82_01185 [Streptosporangiaceae bacterium]
MTDVTGRRVRLASPTTALVLGGLVLALIIADVPLAGLARQSLNASGGSLPVWISAPFAVVGFVLAWRKPGNPLGWIILGTAVFLALSEDASYYTVADYRLRHGGLPLGWVALLAQPGWAPAIVLFGLAVLLFPDGRPPSPRLQWMVWVYAAMALLWIASAAALTLGAIIGHHTQVDSAGNLLLLDDGIQAPLWWKLLSNLFFVLGTAGWLVSLAAQALSYRGSTGERRQQLKWLMCGSAVALISILVGFTGLYGTTGSVFVFGFLALPLSIGVAVLRYGLFDIDRIISRTLAYAILTGLLVGVYAGIVLLSTDVLSLTSSAAVAASTLAAAALFNPLRRRVQRVVDRRFNRARYDGEQTVAAFAVRLKDAVDLDSVRDDLAGVVQHALEPAHVSVWISQRD